jgi:hypothetical protein
LVPGNFGPYAHGAVEYLDMTAGAAGASWFVYETDYKHKNTFTIGGFVIRDRFYEA